MKMPITGLSRFEISKIKNLNLGELEEKRKYYIGLAIEMSPVNVMQSNKYWSVVERYEREIAKRTKITEIKN